MTTKAFRTAMRAAQRGTMRARATMLREMAAADASLRLEFERIEQRIRAHARPGITAAQLRRKAERELLRNLDRRARGIGASVEASAIAGREGHIMATRAVLGGNVPMPNLITVTQAKGIARSVLGTGVRDNLSIVTRMRRNSRGVAQRIGATVTDSLRRGESVARSARRLLDADSLKVELPRYVRDIRSAVHSGDVRELRAAVRVHARAISRLKDGGLVRNATRDFVKSAETMSAKGVERQLDHWVNDRVRSHETMIARTEMNRAFQRAYVESGEDEPFVVGYRWNLSSAHPKQDECDMIAGKDEHGLGAGGYPKGEVPDPPHPNDQCFVTSIMDTQYLRRKTRQLRGEAEPPKPWETAGGQDGEAWLRSQSDSTQQSILGPGRAREFADGASVVGSDGVSFRLLRDIAPANGGTRRN